MRKILLRLEHSQWSVLDLKARYRGAKYLHETLKILPQKPDTIVIDQIAEHLGLNRCYSSYTLSTQYLIIGEGIDCENGINTFHKFTFSSHEENFVLFFIFMASGITRKKTKQQAKQKTIIV